MNKSRSVILLLNGTTVCVSIAFLISLSQQVLAQRVSEPPSNPTLEARTTPIPPTETPSVEPPCMYYKMDFSLVSGQHARSSKRTSSVKLDHSKVNGLDCLSYLITKANSKLGSSYKEGMSYKHKVLMQNFRGKAHAHLYGTLFTGELWSAIKEHAGFKVAGSGATDQEILADNEQARTMMNCVPGLVVRGFGHHQIGGAWGKDLNQEGCVSGSLFFAGNCKLADKDDVDEGNLCGGLEYYAKMATPISLVWSDDYAKQSATLVNFKLDPYSEEDVWMWKASESLPLLVYDHGHTGPITSATELFGDWTFGGKGRPDLSRERQVRTPWRDGYEALSVMDKNHDDKISGEELEPLALWFDRNQDGISQPGEVVALSKLDIVALFYHADTKEEGALVATKGYERIINGKSVVAKSIDWSEKGLRDGFDVMRDKTGAPLSKLNTAIEPGTDSAANILDRSSAEALEGLWDWALNHPAEGSGILSFGSSDYGIFGTTISQVGIAGVPKVASTVLFAHFKGETSRSQDGSIEIHFTQRGPQGATLANSAKLSNDRNKLLGKTTVTNSPLSQSGSYEYTWIAKRRIVSEE